jgi:peptide/nickel transport system ATP-binding protein
MIRRRTAREPGAAAADLGHPGDVHPAHLAGQPLLEIKGLNVDYGVGDAAVHAVMGADLVLHSSEVLGLAGESGSGKSTLAYAAIRLLRPPGLITGGEVRYHAAPGQSVDLLAADEEQLRRLRWAHIAVVLQSAMNALNPVIRIGIQLTDVLQAHRQGSEREAEQARAAELLEMVGISADRLKSYPHELSGGMRQRVMIAMALALEPRLVILDEPTTALDVVTQREILEELIALRERLGFAVLFITHDLSLLVEVTDSIAVMYAGRIVERAAASSLFRAARHPYTLGLLSSFPPLHGAHRQMTGIPGSPPDLRALPRGCVFHPRCGYAMDRCRTQEPPLVPLRGQGGRLAACWLQEPGVAPPPELGLADPGLGGSPAQPRPTAAAQNLPSAADGASSAADGAAPSVPAPAVASTPEPASVTRARGDRHGHRRPGGRR